MSKDQFPPPNLPPWSHHFPRRSAWREYYRGGRRPPWWPENEPWPPQHWQHRRGRLFRRMGCFFFVVVFLAFMGLLGILRFLLAPFINFPGRPPFDRPDLIVPFGFVGFILLVFAFVWGIRGWRRMSAPLDEMLQASQRVAEGDYSVRVEEKGPPEIYSLTRSFNTMAERLHTHDEQRRNMLADVSHELRTPITVIQGNVEGILDGLYPADEARLKSIIEETHILSRLVDDLRTLALAESGALHLKREATNLSELIHAVVSELEAQVKEKEIRINVSLEGGEELQADPRRIHEVLTNLLSNALRYTPRGGEIHVRLMETGTDAERNVTISVEDNGPGIEPADLPHVFERFYKSSDSGGMGLGLSIARYVVEAHGGKIWAESEVGKGTKISLTFPAL